MIFAKIGFFVLIAVIPLLVARSLYAKLGEEKYNLVRGDMIWLILWGIVVGSAFTTMIK